MRALVFHFSSLVGLLVFLNQLWHSAEIERAIFIAVAAGLVVYTILMIGFAMARRILAATPPPDDSAGKAARPGSAEAGADARTTPSRAV